jgi:acyl-CoA thioester hydrolase
MNTYKNPYLVKVFIEDTDASKFVYHANYLKFLERARTSLIQSEGISHVQLMHKEKIMFVVRFCKIDYKKPSLLEDELRIYTSLQEIVGAQIKVNQYIFREDELLVQANTGLVCITLEGRPTRVPYHIAEILQRSK